jgi:hypothetical protein
LSVFHHHLTFCFAMLVFKQLEIEPCQTQANQGGAAADGLGLQTGAVRRR